MDAYSEWSRFVAGSSFIVEEMMVVIGTVGTLDDFSMRVATLSVTRVYGATVSIGRAGFVLGTPSIIFTLVTMFVVRVRSVHYFGRGGARRNASRG